MDEVEVKESTKDKVVRKMKEPTTWLGIGVLGQLLGIGELAALGDTNVITAIGTIMGIFLNEAPKSRAKKAK